MPETVTLYDGRVAVLDRAHDYTEDPPKGDERPSHGQLFAYYKVDDGPIFRLPISVKMAKFSRDLLPATIAALLLRC